MRLNEIIDRFSLVSGLERKEISRYLPILMDCKEYLERRLRDDLGDADSRRAAYACAVYAWYKISLTAAKEGVAAFQAGDVRITTAADGVNIREMWEHERACIADLLNADEAFGFRSVRI